MRYLGLLGGMSWESTAEYYRLLNRGVARRLGGLHSASLIIHSVDFAGVAALQAAGEWDLAGALLADAAAGLERAGAAGLLLCTNTMHYVSDTIERAVSIPLLHIVDPTGRAMQAAGVQRAALLGTRYTMELPFWRHRLEDRFDIDLIVPVAEDRAAVHRVIYEELCRGRILGESQALFGAIMGRLADAGADAIILGCTEITLLVSDRDTPLPVFDTTALHADAAIDFAIASESAAV